MAEIMNWFKNAMLEVRFASLASKLFDRAESFVCQAFLNRTFNSTTLFAGKTTLTIIMAFSPFKAMK